MTPRQSQEALEHAAERPVRLLETEWVTLADGARLAVKIWLPDGAQSAPVGAIVEWVPYRRSDGTAIRDAEWGTWFAARGFAFVRPDARGSGDSDGIMEDEYTPQEQDDCGQLLDWLADREWCNGSVGMIGVSWGAFAALQQAARSPRVLRGVVPIHGSDDRYADDVHYVGGCVSALDITQWSTSMLAYLNQPPDPRVVGDGWRAEWMQRLERAVPWAVHWLGHQRRDEYWRQGSVCEDYAAIGCPVFAVGGWADGYRDMVMRMLEHVDAPARGLIGPWGHTRPETGRPAPAIGFLQECARFFDATLNGADNGFFDEPALISWMQEPVAPAGSYAERPGRWVAEPSWPSPNVGEWVHELAPEGLRSVAATAAAATGPTGASAGGPPTGASAGGPPTGADTRTACSLQTTGVEGGVWCGDGSPADAPRDQRPDDGASLCWDSEPLSERVELLGRGEARLVVSVDRPQAMLAVRVCDLAPDGASTLVARGLLNLSRREGHDRSVPMPVGEPVAVTIPMQSTSYALPAGHRLRVAISTAYWPWAWPSPEPVTVTVHCGADSIVSLPRREPGPLDEQLSAFGEPERGEPLASETTLLRQRGRRVRRDLDTGELEIEFHWHGSRERIIATDTEMGEGNVTRYRIVDDEPLSATVDCAVSTSLDRPGWSTELRARSTITCDRERFLMTSSLDAFENGLRIHAVTHVHSFPRDGA